MTPEGTKMDLEGVKIKDFGRLIMTSLDAELFPPPIKSSIAPTIKRKHHLNRIS